MQKAVQWNLILHSWRLSYKLFSGAFFYWRSARCWEPPSCFLQHPLPTHFSGRGNHPAPDHPICSSVVRGEIPAKRDGNEEAKVGNERCLFT